MQDPIETTANGIIDAEKQNILGLSHKTDVITINEAITPGRVINGKTTVATAGTAVPLGTSTLLINGVTVKSLSGNTGTVFVGNSTVTSANGFELAAGESIFIAVDNVSDIYINASVNAQSVCYVGG